MWSRVVHEKLRVPQLVEKFPAFYDTRRFIPMLTTDYHSTTCPCHDSYQSILHSPPFHFSKIHFNNIHQSMSLSSEWSHSFRLHTHTHTHTHTLKKKSCVQFSSPPCMPQAQGYRICWSIKEDFTVIVNFFKIPIPRICL
jgi:hypothetical protein